MKKVTRKKRSTEYRIEGSVGLWIDGGSDSDFLRGKKLDETFSAPDDVTAIKSGKEIIEEFLEENKEYNFVGRRPNKSERPVLEFCLRKIVWEMIYEESQPGRPAIPAEPAKPEQIVEMVVS